MDLPVWVSVLIGICIGNLVTVAGQNYLKFKARPAYTVGKGWPPLVKPLPEPPMAPPPKFSDGEFVPMPAFPVSVLKVEPGDTLVLTLNGHCSQEMAESIKALAEERWPGMKAMVLGEGLKVSGVLRGLPWENPRGEEA